VERSEVIPTPSHLTDEQIAAWPLAGLTAWRFVKFYRSRQSTHLILLEPRAISVLADVKAGQNVLITGIGGGVALLALQICLAIGATVYVSSGGADKIAKAIQLGAKGGVSYKDRASFFTRHPSAFLEFMFAK
jgi:NADPH:quinone reductase-like Zn-dependent oxidoreductase